MFLTSEEERRVGFAQWGLIPHWTKMPDGFTSLINARAETVADKPSFKQAFTKGRCLIPASGYYEWAKQEGGKQPYYFQKALLHE
jgi:putative SOS response-associated peptidase YedK